MYEPLEVGDWVVYEKTTNNQGKRLFHCTQVTKVMPNTFEYKVTLQRYYDDSSYNDVTKHRHKRDLIHKVFKTEEEGRAYIKNLMQELYPDFY